MREITENSVRSLFVELAFGDVVLSSGTAFAVETSKGPYLVTNRHNVTGRHQETDAPLSATCGTPTSIIVTHNREGNLGSWIKKTEQLYSDGEPLWIEHPWLKGRADLVALKLTELQDVAIYAHPLVSSTPRILLRPSDVVSVIGFPFGIKASGSFGVWSSGFVASEPNVDYNSLPVLLIDCRSRMGQSGSPVVLFRSGGAIAMSDGSTGIHAGPYSELIGIYSGRVHPESDLGMVWKVKAIRELISLIENPAGHLTTLGGSYSSVFSQNSSLNWARSTTK